ncbi:Pkinase-domain-containing protein [Basidiobolus meristosporus CBS 931.73]|uniref:Pkinase-domain-containing protein n=1 Tax=Basidiobolus meristosporus CBS 931.73 TaxID=1314790 RepID=A0A1Y1YL15_9FUNG|nr:Pkinase-domain-containing protein [Basidiobolus meristosporus CBS 931.73]|eukprot:ORX98707.1 Pkinase-domain-containing protein [Basidiobolus meristosporus CBS 931.73]
MYPELERYQLLEKLGDGAFSDVYKAFDRVCQRFAAVKVVRKFQLNAVQRGNILKEVTIMRNINHCNVARLLDFKETKDFYFLVLELLEGGELFHRIVKLTYFSEDLARHVITQVARGIQYLHDEKGVIHRDTMSDEPIELDEEKLDEGDFVDGIGGGGIGVVKIADFGLSKVIPLPHHSIMSILNLATLGYTAPEVVRDERYSKSVDMWALGCVLYTLLCGFPPFYDEEIHALTEKVAIGHFSFLSPWWDDISESAKDLVSQLLTVDPSVRYTIADFFSHPWIKGEDSGVGGAHDTVPPDSDEERSIDANHQTNIPRKTRHLMPLPVTPSISIKEAIDVSYAVHRMEDEEAAKYRFRNAVQGHHATGIISNPAHHRGFLEVLQNSPNSEDINTINAAFQNAGLPGRYKPQRRSQLTPGASTSLAPETAATKRDFATSRAESGSGFELSLDQATLLSRRKAKLDC